MGWNIKEETIDKLYYYTYYKFELTVAAHGGNTLELSNHAFVISCVINPPPL